MVAAANKIGRGDTGLEEKPPRANLDSSNTGRMPTQKQHSVRKEF